MNTKAKKFYQIITGTNGHKFTSSQVTGLLRGALNLMNPHSKRGSQYAGTNEQFRAEYPAACEICVLVNMALISEQFAYQTWFEEAERIRTSLGYRDKKPEESTWLQAKTKMAGVLLPDSYGLKPTKGKNHV